MSKESNEEKFENETNSSKTSNKKTGRRNRRSKSRQGGTNKDQDFKHQMTSDERYGVNRPHVLTNSGSSNDASWYTHIYPLAKDVASMALNLPVGPYQYEVTNGPITYPTGWDAPTLELSKSLSVTALTVPGIMTIKLAPTVGTCINAQSAANIAAQQIYTLVRKANSGAINYDKTDLMRMIIAMDSAYMLYEYALRIYRTFGMYNYQNRYMPDVLLQAEGANPILINELADFRALLDNFAYQLGSINVPDQFDFVRRHSWLFSNVYKDADTDKAQMYLFVPDGFYQWVEGSGSEPAYLKYVTTQSLFGDGIRAVAQLQAVIQSFMRPLLGSQDVGTMCGDLAKAFGEGGMIKISPVSSHEALTPVYDMEVITQMSNAIIYESGTIDHLDIKNDLSSLTDGPFLVQQPYAQYNQAATKMHKHLFNMQKQDVSPEEVMVATRLMSVLGDASVPTDHDPCFPFKSWGTEIAVGANMYVMTANNSGFPSVVVLDLPQNIEICNSASASSADITGNYHNVAQLLIGLSKFDNHPTIYLFENGKSQDIDGPTGTLSYAGEIQDVNCFLWLEDAKIGALNDVAILSEFAARAYGTGV
nr:putative capsid [Marmot picobirnavirus]